MQRISLFLMLLLAACCATGCKSTPSGGSTGAQSTRLPEDPVNHSAARRPGNQEPADGREDKPLAHKAPVRPHEDQALPAPPPPPRSHGR